jgi:hypothetical protein
MGLVCSLTGHKADAAQAVWNGGICFGKCSRCGCDLVRTIRDLWQVPRGYKVVWRASPKSDPEPIAAEAAAWSEAEIPVEAEWEESWEPAHAPEWPVKAAKAEPAVEVQQQDEVAASESDQVPALEEVETEALQNVEWPLVASVVEAEAEPAPANVVTEPVANEEEAPRDIAGVPDFMDDWADDMDWDDLPDQRQRAAAG